MHPISQFITHMPGTRIQHDPCTSCNVRSAMSDPAAPPVVVAAAAATPILDKLAKSALKRRKHIYVFAR